MIRKSIVLKLFQSAYIHRWNDKLRPIDFIESDKHGHKMIIAYILGALEEKKQPVNWSALIEGGIFELLQKLVLTDLKSPVFYRIRADKEKYSLLNNFIFKEIQPFLAPLGEDFCERYKAYFEQSENTLEKRILSAASAYASKWEFEIIERSDPHGFDNEDIKRDLLKKMEQARDLVGVSEVASNPSLRSFIDVCGQLRYQVRWADIHRIPKTSVLTHCLFVGILSYLFSLEMNSSSKRRYNNFFGGLFHDLPEVLTRDIIAPIKRSVEGLRDLIIGLEKEEMDRIIYPLLPQELHADMHLFTEIESRNRVVVSGEEQFVTVDEINASYNADDYAPCDGEIIKAADELSAFVEAYEAFHNGCVNDRFQRAVFAFQEKYEKRGAIGGIDFRALVTDFSS